jgi:hypothetical protein
MIKINNVSLFVGLQQVSRSERSRSGEDSEILSYPAPAFPTGGQISEDLTKYRELLGRPSSQHMSIPNAFIVRKKMTFQANAL